MNARFVRATTRFDEENGDDPNLEAGEPRELLQARRLTDWVLRLEPNASEVLRLAARCQHLRRWEVPRSSFPADRAGYHKWKNHAKTFHAEAAGRILHECGYEDETIQQVRALNLKANFPKDPESQTLEDALCLVFLEFQFANLAARTDRAKMVNALRKSWLKMSGRARVAALGLKFSEFEAELIRDALKE